MMFGAILFLRLGVITANAGIATTLAIIGMVLLFMLVTSLSISSIASNMDVMGSGVYYIVSRALGIKIGGALGIILFLAQLLVIGLTINGFSYLVHDLFPNINTNILEILTISLLAIISIYSTKLALRFQVLILIIILGALISVLFGNPNNVLITTEFQNFYNNKSFWFSFALLFPALTGIEVGMALSASLKNPVRSIFIGNVLALIMVAATYAGIATFAIINVPAISLISDPLALAKYAYSEKMVFLGIAVATLSSSLGSLIAAPRILQTMAEDGIMPKILAKSYGKYKEPIFALITTAILAVIITITTNLEQIIPLITMNCLITYGMLNFIAGTCALINNASWRPSFKIHFSVSFLGVLLAIIFMFMINPGWSFISITMLLTFYLILYKKNVIETFSGISNSLIFFLSRHALYKLSHSEQNVMNWHPIVLMLCASPAQQLKLAKLMNNITAQNGVLIVGSILPEDNIHPEKILSSKLALQNFLHRNNIKSLAEVNFAASTQDGFVNFINTYGIGSMQPNTIALSLDNKLEQEDIWSLFYSCYLSKKNILLFQNEIKPSKPKDLYALLSTSTQIDIWWNSNAKNSFNLILTLVVALHSSKYWRNAVIKLKCIATSVNAEQGMRDYLEKFISLSRLKMQICIYNSTTASGINEAIKTKSDNSKISFIPLEDINFKEDPEQAEHYKAYFFDMINNLNKNNTTILCCALDGTDHQEIYSYPKSKV